MDAYGYIAIVVSLIIAFVYIIYYNFNGKALLNSGKNLSTIGEGSLQEPNDFFGPDIQGTITNVQLIKKDSSNPDEDLFEITVAEFNDKAIIKWKDLKPGDRVNAIAGKGCTWIDAHSMRDAIASTALAREEQALNDAKVSKLLSAKLQAELETVTATYDNKALSEARRVKAIKAASSSGYNNMWPFSNKNKKPSFGGFNNSDQQDSGDDSGE